MRMDIDNNMKEHHGVHFLKLVGKCAKCGVMHKVITISDNLGGTTDLTVIRPFWDITVFLFKGGKENENK